MNMMISVPHVPAPPPASPVKVDFSDERDDFVDLAIKGAFLELITFGFYRFWLATDIRRHLWSHTSIDGDAPEYTGRGRELLIGFLFAVAILVPINVAYFIVGIETERYAAFGSIPLFLFLYMFGQFAVYRARRYRLTRTVWRGVRFWMDGSGWLYALRAAGWGLLATITLGAVLPWRAASLERYKMRHCHYGDLQGSFHGKGSELFKRGWKLWLATLSPFIFAAVVDFLSNGHERLVWVDRLVVVVAMAWLIALPFIFGAFRAIEWRWWVSGIRFGEVSFGSDLKSGALCGLYWKVIGWNVLLPVGLSVYSGFCIAIFAGFEDPAHISAQIQGGNWAFAMAIVIGYLGYVLAMNVVLRVYLMRDIWARVAASVTVYHLEAAANVGAKGELADAIGEGLDGGLDVGL